VACLPTLKLRETPYAKAPGGRLPEALA
jgi:hypothetical protein